MNKKDFTKPSESVKTVMGQALGIIG